MIVEIRDEVISLSGALRKNHWQTLESAIRIRLRQHPTGIVIDCAGIDAITPEGAQTFAQALEHFEERVPDARLVIAEVPAHVMLVLRRIPELGSRLPTADTVEAARRSLGFAPTPVGVGAHGAMEIVVALLGTPADEHAVALACRLAVANRPEENRDPGAAAGAPPRAPRIHLAYPLQVPRDRPLLSPLAEEEASAVRTLKRFEEYVRRQRLVPLARLERTRDTAGRLVRLARDLRAAYVVLSVIREPAPELQDVIERIVAAAPCEVLVNRLSDDATFSPTPEPPEPPQPTPEGH
ncbi:MAG TPA: hypothetical protein VM490_22370 [Armatimonadaceae bacterium]|nr:hypothetical protein [Armatimonadaceae bacterium]